VTEAFLTTSTLIIVAVHILEVNTVTRNHYEVFLNRKDREFVSSDKGNLSFGIVFCRIDTLCNEVLFLS